MGACPQIAESFGSDPERYDRARPRYPDAMVERIVAASPGVDVLDVGTGTGPDAYSALGTKAADGMRQAGAFGDAEEWRFDWDRSYVRDEWLDVVPTFGGYSQFPPAAQEDLLAGIGAAINAAGGSFTMGYTTVVATAARKTR